MIKRVIGIVASLAILALIVFTVLGAGSYKSMLPETLFSSDKAVEAVVEEVAEEVQDDVTEGAEPADSTALDLATASEEASEEQMPDGAETATESDGQSIEAE